MPASGLARVVITDCNHGTIAPEEDVLRDVAKIELHQRNDEEGLLGFCLDADGIITQYGAFTRRVLKALRRCKVICRYGVGVDTVDLAAATECGIIVAFVPDYCTDEVSNHAAALILALHRGVRPLDREVRAGTWQFRAAAPIMRLAGQTLGIVGLGRIGFMLAGKLRPFGLTILATDPYRKDWPDWIRRVSLDELLAASDIVSVHCPLTAETRHLIGAAALRKMKRSAFLVNTARGGVVDTGALVQVLYERRIAGAALDVQEVEPMPADHPLATLDNLILTPHAAWYSEGSIVELKRKVATAVRLGLEGKIPSAVANPEVLTRAPWAAAR
ncbi:MAG: C-terminal binding protein [candidate division NC10 bacterium]|nr:C-terminal binding protein [candidate division NC10 bacterium]